jgi:hypothetical protein
VTDASGNSSTCIFEVTVNDTEAPIISCPDDVTIIVPFGSSGGNVNLSNAIATDNCPIINIENDFNSNGGNASGFYPIGTNMVTYTATDAAGNSVQCQVVVTVNEAAPDQLNISCPQNVFSNNDPGLCGSDLTISLASFSGGAPPVSITNTFNNGGADASGFYPVGITNVIFTASDDLGNTTVCSFSVTVEDADFPLVFCPENITVSNDPGQCGAVVTFEANTTDNCAATINYQPASGAFFSVGTTNVTATTTDASGNSSTCTFEVTVNDTEAPQISCPDDITVSNDPGQCGTVVTFEATTTDNCAVTVSYQPASGSFFSTGTTNVTATATDASGNTSTCTFEVIVNDTEAPQISCPDDVTIIVPFGSGGGNVILSNAIATDNCSNTNITNDFNNNDGNASDFYPIGITTVVFTASDAAGNSVQCQVNVLVNEADESFEFNVSGTTLMENATPVPGAALISSFSTMPLVYTNSSGNYTISNITPGATFTVSVDKDTNHTQGISTFDIVLIQRHILQIEALNSPYEKIAADVNNNSIIEIGDIIQLRRIILQLDTQFIDPFSGLPNNVSWKFVLPGLTDPFPTSPIVPIYSETLSIENISGNINNVDWIAVKIGDVNNSADPINMMAPSIIFNRSPWIWDVEDVRLNKGDTYRVKITNRYPEFVDGFQTGLNINVTTDAVFSEIHSELPGWSTSNFNKIENQILMSWSNIGSEIRAGQTVLEFDIIAPHNAYLSELLRLDQQYLSTEVYNSHGNMNIEFSFSPAEINTTDNSIRLVPNPAQDEVQIIYNWNSQEIIKIQLFNLLGQVIYEIPGEAVKGRNSISVSLSSVSAGHYLVRIQGLEQVISERLIILKP